MTEERARHEREIGVSADRYDYSVNAIKHASPTPSATATERLSRMRLGDEYGATLLHYAIFANSPAIIALLLARGADPRDRTNSGALNALGGLKAEVEAMVRDRIERFMTEQQFVRREEFDAVQAMAATARAEQEKLAARVAELERLLAAKPPA